MASINKVILLGNLGRDPEIKRTSDNKPIGQFTLATSEVWSGHNGEKQTRTEWHRIVVFNEHLVSIVERFLKKGTRVYVEGQIRTRKWTDQNNQENVVREVVLNRYRGEIILVGDRQAPSGMSSSDSGPDLPKIPEDTHDDIPF